MSWRWRRSLACAAAVIIARRGRPDYVVPDRHQSRSSDLSVEFAARPHRPGLIVEDDDFLIGSKSGGQARLAAVLRQCVDMGGFIVAVVFTPYRDRFAGAPISVRDACSWLRLLARARRSERAVQHGVTLAHVAAKILTHRSPTRFR